VALDDAIEQGVLFCNMLAENTKVEEESVEAKMEARRRDVLLQHVTRR
jgi:hypothetical protein